MKVKVKWEEIKRCFNKGTQILKDNPYMGIPDFAEFELEATPVEEDWSETSKRIDNILNTTFKSLSEEESKKILFEQPKELKRLYDYQWNTDLNLELDQIYTAINELRNK